MKIVISSTTPSTTIDVLDDSDKVHHRIAQTSGKTLREAVTWMVRRVNRIADQTEQKLVELGLVTEEEIEEILTEMEEEKAADTPEPGSTP